MKKNVWKKYIKSLPKLTPAGKKALLKYGAILLFIILGFSLLSRALTHNGQTLAQYGEANPSLQRSLSVSGGDAAPAGGSSGNAGVSGNSADMLTDSAGTDAEDGQGDNGQEHEDTAWQVSADGLTGNGGAESPKRVSGFYVGARCWNPGPYTCTANTLTYRAYSPVPSSQFLNTKIHKP